jgi:transcriptional regulator with XRE-family HTH domain
MRLPSKHVWHVDFLGCRSYMTRVPRAPTGFYEKLGGRIAEARKRARLTQVRLAELLGLSRTSVVNIERGRQPLAAHSLVAVADALGASVVDLLPPPASDRANGGTVSGAHWDGLPQAKRDWVERVLRTPDLEVEDELDRSLQGDEAKS